MRNIGHIGVVAAKNRIVYNADKFNYLFKPLKDRVTIILDKDATTEKTVELMIEIVEKFNDEVKDFAQFIKGKTVYDTCQNIYNFLVKYIRYKLDDGEELRRPARVFWDRLADCDCGSIFWGACLKQLKIPFRFRITKYSDVLGLVGNWQHVYIVVPTSESKEIICDFVMDSFNKEKSYAIEKSNFNMKSLEGIEVKGLFGTETKPRYTDYDAVLMGLDFLNGQGDEYEQLYTHLKRTRNLIAQKPQLYQGVKQLLEMFDYAIKYWNTPHRTIALDRLAMYEQELIKKGTLPKPEKEWFLDTDFTGKEPELAVFN